MVKNLKLKQRRKARVRSKILKLANYPRLSVFRSNQKIYAQIIDDKKRQTLVAASVKDLSSLPGASKIEQAKNVGQILAKKALEKGIKKVVFDRGCYKFHGRLKALASGAREGGLHF